MSNALAANGWLIPVLAGIIVGLMSAAMRILWGRLQSVTDAAAAMSVEIAVLKEKQKCAELRAGDKNQEV